MTTLEILSRNVKQLRRMRGYTQETLCEKTGVSEREISKVERMVVDPGTKIVDALAKGFQLSAAELLKENLEIPAAYSSERKELKEKLARELDRMAIPEQQMLWEMVESYRRCKEKMIVSHF